MSDRAKSLGRDVGSGDINSMRKRLMFIHQEIALEFTGTNIIEKSPKEERKFIEM